jgi:hypothetical protein
VRSGVYIVDRRSRCLCGRVPFKGRRNRTDRDQLRHVELLGELRLALGADPIGVHLLPPHQTSEPATPSPPAAAATTRLQCHQGRRRCRGRRQRTGLSGRIPSEGGEGHLVPRIVRGGWTERKAERRARGVDRDGKSSAVGRSFPLSLSCFLVPTGHSRAFLWYLCWKLAEFFIL